MRKVHVFTDASVQRNGMGYAWLATDEHGGVLGEGAGRILSTVNPEYGSTTAEAIGLAIAVRETAQFLGDRTYRNDSQSLTLLVQGKSRTGNQRLAQLLAIIGPINISFDNSNPGIHNVDRRSKRALTGRTHSARMIAHDLQNAIA